MTKANSLKGSLSGACLTVIYLCLVSSVGKAIHNDFAFFPELAALAYGMFMRPAGPWAMAPLMVVTTPTVTALWGVSVANHLPYGIPASVLCIAGSILIVKTMKSPVFPAVPAGFLPLVFNVTSVHYVAFIVFDTGLLALLSVAYRRWWLSGIGKSAVAPVNTPAPANTSSKTMRWVTFSGVLAITYFLAARTDIRLILFPPLLVIAYESLVRPETCPWARRFALLPVICVLTAGLGWAGVALFGAGPLSVLCALGASIVFIRVIDTFVLPALVISVIPQIIVRTDWKYPLAIGTGTLVVVTARSLLNVIERFQSRSAGDWQSN
ncbi:HPP family protein [Variovorax sp. YR216]|uniref:HPP family protein n=1 Tax=Variovorax sp. YR216 TaxID=1882828 RepID=UPI00089D2B91|nr:HPP family protein [Variovorax sp. YR216]SEA04775.1 hypothetical protein SAMN05444680_101327 [Variovorax sp. YR216]